MERSINDTYLRASRNSKRYQNCVQNGYIPHEAPEVPTPYLFKILYLSNSAHRIHKLIYCKLVQDQLCHILSPRFGTPNSGPFLQLEYIFDLSGTDSYGCSKWSSSHYEGAAVSKNLITVLCCASSRGQQGKIHSQWGELGRLHEIWVQSWVRLQRRRMQQRKSTWTGHLKFLTSSNWLGLLQGAYLACSHVFTLGTRFMVFLKQFYSKLT